MRITIIGSGNMGGAIALGLAKGTIVNASDITCTARSEETLARLKAANAALNVTTDNRAAVGGTDGRLGHFGREALADRVGDPRDTAGARP